MAREFTFSTSVGDLSWVEGEGWFGEGWLIDRVEEAVAAGLSIPRTATGPEVVASSSDWLGAFTVAGLVAAEQAERWGDGRVEFVGSRPPPVGGVEIEGLTY